MHVSRPKIRSGIDLDMFPDHPTARSDVTTQFCKQNRRFFAKRMLFEGKSPTQIGHVISECHTKQNKKCDYNRF